MRAWQRPEWRARLLALYAQRWTDKAIGEALGCADKTVRQARKALQLPVKPRPVGPNMSALHAEARPGCCVACDGPLTGRQRMRCGDAECARLYHSAYRLDWHANVKLRARTERRTA